MPISPDSRRQHLEWLLELTQIPTASGREHRVTAWIDRWLAERTGLQTRRDDHGNLEVRLARVTPSFAPLYFTAHLDHPAFVVTRLLDPARVELEFRGGVGDDYFTNAPVVAFTADDRRISGTLTGLSDRPQEPLKRYLCQLDPGPTLALGDIARWHLPPAEIAGATAATSGGAGLASPSVSCVYTDACDDLAAAAAALAAMDHLLQLADAGEPIPDVRVLFTRAEEIGFVGAIAACKSAVMPPASRIIALENSRSFADSPIGAGPVVRVGDRVTVFSPSLSAAVAKRCEEIGGPQPLASQKLSEGPSWKWQRKLMAGGACEASVFCAYAYQSTCVCLPLGNYHNMADLEAVQAGTNKSPPRAAREFIAVSDYHALVDLLIACGQRLPEDGGFMSRIEKLWDKHQHVLTE